MLTLRPAAPSTPRPPAPQNVLQTNVSVSNSLGQPFITQFNIIFSDMLQVGGRGGRRGGRGALPRHAAGRRARGGGEAAHRAFLVTVDLGMM